MARYITLKATTVGLVEPLFGQGVAVDMNMTLDQKLDAIDTIAATLTPDQWDAVKEQLDKEFAT